MVIDTNVDGPFIMARAATPHMIAAGRGRIINITLNHATMRRRGFSPYGPSKAAVESETIIWAQELDGTGVTVNALLPGGAAATGMIPGWVSRIAAAEGAQIRHYHTAAAVVGFERLQECDCKAD